MDILPTFASWLSLRGIQPDPNEAAAALWLAGQDGADVLDRELSACMSMGLPIEMGVLSALLSPWAQLLERLRNEPDRPPEELPELNEVDAYLLGEWLPVTSSNVRAIRYLPDDEALEVEYRNGAFYRYEDIPEMMAKDFALADSPGKWVWDWLRRRGTVFGYQKRYQFISGPSAYEPKWMQTLEKRLLHGKIQPEGIVPAAMLSNWHEEEHPRGQPENKGEFVAKGKAVVKGKKGKTVDAPAQPAENRGMDANFVSWFGNSAVSKNGKPLVVYTGQPKGLTAIQETERSELPGSYAYFTTDPEVAKLYSGEADSEVKGRTEYSTGRKGQVYKAHLSIQKPWDLDQLDQSEWLNASGDPEAWSESVVRWLRKQYEEESVHDIIKEEAARRETDISEYDLTDRYDIEAAVQAIIETDAKPGAGDEWKEAMAHAKLEGFKDAVGYDGDSNKFEDIAAEATSDWLLQGLTLQDALRDSLSGKLAVMFPKLAKKIIKKHGYDGYVHTDAEVGGTTWIPTNLDQIRLLK